MDTTRLNDAVARAQTFRLLRDVEMNEARRVRRELAAAVGDALVRAALSGRVQQLVKRAREWNRRLIKAERAVRAVLMARRRDVVAGRARRIPSVLAALRSAGAQ